MYQPIAITVSLIAGYLLGSIPTAYLLGRIKEGIDIRTVGSKNMGAMNSFYRLGFVSGLIVLVVDMGKGAAAVLFARLLGTPDLVEMLAGAMAVVGHNWPVWLKFKGGKGGATVIGVIGFLMPWIFAIGFPIFALLVLITKVPTISYGVAMVSFPFVAWLVYHRPDYIIFATIMILVPFIKYIPRLFEMRSKAGSWKGVFARRSIKERI
jgi:acyl phosphate:glycerol-3-phosphate acyltransferase